ncbi:MAG: class 1 fructose-bisphosphatase [Acidobacteriota bacterium]|nr:MAG: class 1 fructose-bisphosphatase [Acidobacteriota bacterium]
MEAPVTLIEHITASQRQYPLATGAFTMLMEAVALAAKIIAHEVNTAGLGRLIGLSGRRNVQGEEVAKMDEFANATFVHTLTRCGEVCALASEELAVPIRLPGVPDPAHYAVVFDPLDGSSNIDVSVPVGTIFGVYRRVSAADGLGAVEDMLQKPRALVAAGYALYGSSTNFVYSTGRGVHGFTYDPTLGEFLLSHSDIRVPARGSIISANLAYRPRWEPDTERGISSLLEPSGSDTRYSLRYVGSLVADAHRTLLKGGLFLYPADRNSPQGKLRLLYEAGPFAYLFENAGGKATDGRQPILDKQPETLHDRTALIIGGREDVDAFLNGAQST